MDVSDINAALLHRVDALLAALPLPKPCPGASTRAERRFGSKGSLAVTVAGERRGRFADFEGGLSGDLVDLVAWALGCDLKGAIAWARDWLGLPDDGVRRVRPKAGSSAPRGENAVSAPADPTKRRAAWAVWKAGVPARGTLVDRYLSGRGLAMPDPAPWLRFHPALRTAPDGAAFPAMLAAVQDGAGLFLAVHRTWICERPDGSVGKAPVSPARKILGPARGGAIRLDGGGGSDFLALAEGIETGLAVRQVASRVFGMAVPVWAVIWAGGFRTVALPDAARRVLICADGDEPDLARKITLGPTPTTAAGKQVAKAYGHWRASGRSVAVIAAHTIPGGPKRDFNDLIMPDGNERDGSAHGAGSPAYTVVET